MNKKCFNLVFLNIKFIYFGIIIHAYLIILPLALCIMEIFKASRAFILSSILPVNITIYLIF